MFFQQHTLLIFRSLFTPTMQSIDERRLDSRLIQITGRTRRDAVDRRSTMNQITDWSASCLRN
jgi:hypothetical protein